MRHLESWTWAVLNVVREAEEAGVIVTVTAQSMDPPSMGNIVLVVDGREKRNEHQRIEVQFKKD